MRKLICSSMMYLVYIFLNIKNKARSIIGSGLYSYRYMFFFDELGKEKHLTFYLIVAVTDGGYADAIAYYGSGDYKKY